MKKPLRKRCILQHACCGAQIISLKLDMVSLTAAHKEAGAAAEAAPADSVAAVNREVLRQVRTARGGVGFIFRFRYRFPNLKPSALTLKEGMQWSPIKARWERARL